jgi:hypothetical protein
MRLYTKLDEAISEIRRDLFKGPRVISTRVQQWVDKELPGRELLAYSYSIEEGGIPSTAEDLVLLGVKTSCGHYFVTHPTEMAQWLNEEIRVRRGVLGTVNEKGHPALAQTLEGNWPAYTYPERLQGALETLVLTLKTDPDSRRAFWPIFTNLDSKRAMAPTRIPCSLGYQVLIRNTQEGPRLVMVYTQRSADFDTFFLSDIFLAHAFQREVAERVGVPAGQFIHLITSLHSFTVEGTEIY